MRLFIFITTMYVFLSAVASTAGATPPTHLWSRGYDGSLDEYGEDVAVDSDGNVILVGHFRGTIDLGGGVLTAAGGSFLQDIYVAKYSPTGVHLWSQRFGDEFGDIAWGVAVDASGNVYVTGFFTGTVSFGGQDHVSNQLDIFVAKYDPNGGFVWSVCFSGEGQDQAYDIAVDSQENAIIVGQFSHTIDFGDGPVSSIANSNDVCLVKLDASGSHLWSETFGGTSSETGKDIAVGPSDNISITGFFGGTADFGGGNLNSAGGNDIFVAHYDPSGGHIWSKGFGGTDDERGLGVAIDGGNNTVITGSFKSAVDFGGGLMPNSGFSDVFLAQFDATGAHNWSQVFGNTLGESGDAVAIDPMDRIVITGDFNSDSINFGGGNLPGNNSTEIFLAEFDAAGNHLWSAGFPSTSTDFGRGVATDASGNVTFSGGFRDNISFGGSLLTSSAFGDVFLARLSPWEEVPFIESADDVLGDQGGFIAVEFQPSAYDNVSTGLTITQYEVYLRPDAPPSPVAAMGAPRESSMPDPWTLVATEPATQSNGYTVQFPTIADSTKTYGQFYSVFYVRAVTDGEPAFFDSAPDSGYSVDNLAPDAPIDLVYNAGILSWSVGLPIPDLHYFTVYCANTSDFGASTLVGTTTGTSLDVSGQSHPYFFVTGTDSSGNEGPPETLFVPTGVDDTPSAYALSVGAHPNPFNPATTITYSVPTPGRVNVAVYNLLGALVATPVDGERRSIGVHEVIWHGRDHRGEDLPSGVYFVRIEHDGKVRAKKITLVK